MSGKRKTIQAIGTHAVLILLSVVFLFPCLFMLFKSFMTPLQSVGNPEIVFFPTEWDFGNYAKALDASFMRYLGNTMLIVACNLIAVPLSAAFCAYGFARCDFAGKKFLFGFVLSTMMLPSIVVQIPLYVMFTKLQWLNTPLPFTVPAFFGGGAVNIFLFVQFMRTIPKSLDEAAIIDGASRFRIFFRIYLPLLTPVIVFVMIGAFNGVWNDFMGPLMYLRKEASYTLALGVFYKYAGRLSENNFPSMQMATGVLMIIPSAIVFFVFQRQLIEGVTLSGLKG